MTSTGQPTEWVRTDYRCQTIRFGGDGQLALLTEFDRETRQERIWKLHGADSTPRMLLERSSQDAYGDPGVPVTRINHRGESVIWQQGPFIYLAGPGASKDGERPFLDRWNLTDETKERLFQSSTDRFESFTGFLDEGGQRILVSSESPQEPRNFHALNLGTGEREALTQFTDAAAAWVGKVQRTMLRYTRADGVPLSGELYLPPDWVPGQRLPVVIWTYPVEFNRPADAGQVRGSPHRHLRLQGGSHLWLVLAGYAVLDRASMPIVGPLRTANDTFVQQLVWNAEAAVNALVEHGVGDRERMAVAGHSYGAFMTANLLCHSDLFATGIARSGAYNRSLTPFGFQNEDRTYWEAPAIYHAMSPFANAQKLRRPILLIHGDADENAGTFPMQSQRLYAAVKGHGGTARLVMLPHEGHSYRARESIHHCLAEMIGWLDRQLKYGAPTTR